MRALERHILGFVVAAPLLACSSKDDEGGALHRPGNTGGQGGTTAIIPDPNGKGGSSSSGATGNPGDCGTSVLNGCVGEFYEGESLPLDIYVMFDQSGSMLNDVGGLTRLAAVQQATREFLREPASAGIGVGIGYFGHQPIGETRCEDALYASPAVPVSLDHEPVIRSLDERVATGETPTASALRGACTYASDWKRKHPGHGVVILLVTDGKPEAPVSCAGGGCCPTIDDAEAAALACRDEAPNVPTYVLGVGPELDLLNRIAVAGGTRRAYLVGNENVAENVLAALSTIRGDAAIPCTLEIPEPPPGDSIDFGAVNLFAGQSGVECLSPIYHVTDVTGCGEDGGWYYDDPSSPSAVELCAASCESVSRPGSRLRFSVGCATIGDPVR
ncbi:MAG TPA: vWA domain-containing protein [Polyangiaceae bacterium]